MSDINPYQTPEQNLETHQSDEYSEVKALSAKGRIGRIRFIAYSVGYGLLLNIAVALVTALSTGIAGGAGEIIMALGMLLAYGAFLIAIVLLTIQRVHDFNTSGWLSIIMVLPIISLLLWFIPGTATANDYGNPTPPNTTGVVLVALIIPIIAVIGILAAIAIPAYQEYIQAAQQVTGS